MTPGGFGIDLGTSFARASVIGARGPELVRSEGGAGVVPAVVSVQPDGDLVGDEALFVAATRPDAVLRSFTRMLGRGLDHPSLRTITDAPCLRRQDGGITVEVGGRRREPEDLAAIMIDHLAELAKVQTGQRPGSATFTIPLWFDAAAERALDVAATRAKIPVERIVSEAHAAALALQEARGDVEKKVVIVDVGAGGVGVSVLAVSKIRIVLRASRSESRCGGNAVDRALLDLVLADLGDRGAVLRESPRELDVLRRTLEGMKRELTDPRIDEAARSAPVPLVLDRDRLDKALAGTLALVDEMCAGTIADAELGPGQIDAVYAAGGMAQLPSLRARIAAAFGRRGEARKLPEGAAALGAAMCSQAHATRAPIAPLEDQRPSVPPPPPIVSSIPPPSPLRSLDVAAIAPSASDRAPAIPPPPRPMAHIPMRPSAIPPRMVSDFVPAKITIAPRPPASSPSPPEGNVWSVAPSGEVAPAPGYAPPTSPPPPAPGSTPPPLRTGAWSDRSSPFRAPSMEMASVRPATRPPSMRASRRPLLEDVPEGGFEKPRDASALVGLPGARPLEAGDFEALSLFTLLVRVVADARINGNLTLTTGDSRVEIPVQEGRALVTPREQNALVEAFTWTKGAYRFEAARVKAKAGVRSMSMVRIAVDGLRLVGRGFETRDVETALAATAPMTLAPMVRADKEGLVGRLGLNAMETRTLDNAFDGATSGFDIIEGGRQGRQTTIGLLTILVIFNVLEWEAVRGPAAQSLEDLLAARAAKMDGQDHFLALGAHWSNTSAEIDERYRSLCDELVPKPDASPVVKEALLRMRRRADVAYAVLRDPNRRQAYRREVYPIDYDAAADLAEKRAVALSMRTDQKELESTVGMAKELGRTAALEAMPELDVNAATKTPSSRHPVSGPPSPRPPPSRPPGGSTPPRR